MAMQGARYAGRARFSEWLARALDPHGLAVGLGWFSIGLGVAEIVAPRQLARLIGSPKRPLLIRAFGLREIATGIGILATAPPPLAWTWSRVAGDALDLAALGKAFTSRRANPTRLAATVLAVAGALAADVYCGVRLRRPASVS
ncbi:MAG TPA: hypothetical protein VGL09_06325 [Methylomirabilota bacterium]|jgi:ethanolamine utilization microcompartment shell protein EutS